MDSDQRFWLALWAVVVTGFVAIVIAVTIGLYYAQINATEQLRVCAEAGMSFVDQDGNGTCLK